MSYISAKVRKRVRQRARNRCEYCLSQQDLVNSPFQIDHFIPIAHGGSDDEDNLCLACEMCNQFKWARIDAVDPQTGHRTSLYNPRQDMWSDHFIWSADGTEIVGLTEIGRATVNALKMNNNLAVTVRKNWCNVGWHPPALD